MVATGLNVDARPPVPRAETLASFGKELPAAGVTSEGVTSAKTLLDERAKNPQAEGQWGRRALRQVQESRQAHRFTEQSAQKDKAAFKEPHASKEAGKRIDQITTVSSALELAGMTPDQQQARFDQMKKEGTLPKGIKDIADLTTRATEILASDPYIEGLLEGAFPAERTAFVQSLLAGNGAGELRAALGKHMAEIHEEIAKLPADQQPKAEDPNKAALEQAKGQRDAAVSRMAEVLKARTGKSLTEAQSRMLTEAMNTDDPAQRELKVIQAVAQITGIPASANNALEFSKYILIGREIRIIGSQLKSATKAEQKVLLRKKQNLQTQQKQLEDFCIAQSGSGTDRTNPKYQEWKQKHNLTETIIDSSDFVSAQQTYISNSSEINRLSLIPAQTTEVSVSAARSIAEGKVVDRLDSVLGEAFNDVLESREKQLSEAVTLQQQKSEKEAQEQGEKNKVDDLAQLHKSENNRWIEPHADKKKDVVHVTDLDDVRMLSYHGEFGERLMVMRDAGLIKSDEYEKAVAKINAGTESAEQAFNRLKAHKGVGTRFDAIYTAEESKTYRADLMTKYFTAQRLMKEGLRGHAIRWGRGIEIDRTGYKFPERFNLNENEWVRLHGHFETEIIDSLQKPKEGQQFIEQLKAQGIVGEPSLKKWLYLLSLLLGLGVSVGASAAFTPAIGAAVGLGTAGVGARAAQGSLRHSAI